MSVFDYSSNVGEIVLRKDECFWIFPSEYINIAIYSPWFSYMGEKWRLVKLKNDSNSGNFVFRVWMKLHSNPLRNKYTIQLTLRTTCQITCENRLVTKTVEPDPDYGCELKFPYSYCRCNRILNIINQNGLVKLPFNIQKQENINDATETGDKETSDEVEESSSDEHEERSEDEKNSDEGDTSKNKSVVAEAKVDDDDTIFCNRIHHEVFASYINDTFNIVINTPIEEVSDYRRLTRNSMNNYLKKGIRRLAENFKQIFLNGELSDMVLKVEDREFNVHKVVLAARSPVFAPMFKHDLAEKKDNVVNIPDCTVEAFEVFLHYLYCGSNETMSTSNVYNVYYAADKYQVDDLKEVCVKFMKKNLSLETFCDIIGLSLHHGESKLQKAATGFFCENVKKILKTVQWQKYMAENPTHANELLIKALNA